jgi:hypothetical protein
MIRITPGSIAPLLLAASIASADINLEFRTVTDAFSIGDSVLVDLYAVSDTPDTDQALAAIEAIISWPETSLQLIEIVGGGEASLAFEGFPILGSNGLNEVDPPQDGDGLYIALSSLGTPTLATPAGTRITTFRFDAIANDEAALINIDQLGGDPERSTIVFSGIIPNKDVTGTLTGVTVSIGPVACSPADVNADGVLDFFDVQLFLNAFSTQDSLADFAPPEGVFDFFDVQSFLQIFSEGCP